MPTPDPRIDAYIAAAPDFARPILERLRAAVHAAVPDAEEGIKWSRPHFLLDGKILCGMSAFKAHCAFGFWANRDAAQAASGAGEREAMGQFGRLESVKDLPSATALKKLLKDAAAEMRQAAAEPRPAAPRPAPRAALPVPDDLRTALDATRGAMTTFDGWAPSHRREYIEWIEEAKKADTRARRVAQAVQWIAEGKHRNWKYESC